eukprot:3938976-Pyramimonas_sp.AAC.1
MTCYDWANATAALVRRRIATAAVDAFDRRDYFAGGPDQSEGGGRQPTAHNLTRRRRVAMQVLPAKSGQRQRHRIRSREGLVQRTMEKTTT